MQIGVLVHELLLVEAWHEKIYPLAKDRALAIPQGSLRMYFILYHESCLINLLEVHNHPSLFRHKPLVHMQTTSAQQQIMLYYDHVAEAAEDSILEIVCMQTCRINCTCTRTRLAVCPPD